MPCKTVKYIGFYDIKSYEHENRCSSLAAINKMTYIAKTLESLGNKVEIISPSWTENSSGFYFKRNIQITEKIALKCSFTFGSKLKLLRAFRVFWALIWLFFYLLMNTQKDEVVVVYHSMMIMRPIMLAKKIKRFKLSLEVEEIYQDVTNFSKRMNYMEYEFFKTADSYIFPTELLNLKLNTGEKPNVIIYGTYHVEEEIVQKLNDSKIHIVYAGTFDPRKGGALAAAAAAEYLSPNYHVHIIGFGTDKDTSHIIDSIEKISKLSKATITYDGLLKGDEYNAFLQKCHIGLSTQIPGIAYNDTSFPSKILSYMANGLRVVSIRIKAIEISEIGQSVYYYDEPSPEAIANAISAIDVNVPYDGREIIRRLNVSFKENIRKVIG